MTIDQAYKQKQEIDRIFMNAEMALPVKYLLTKNGIEQVVTPEIEEIRRNHKAALIELDYIYNALCGPIKYDRPISDEHGKGR